MSAKQYKTLPFGYRRVDNLPLEENTVFASLDAANTYATTNPTAYAGQWLAVVSEGDSKFYIIKPDMSLKEIGVEGTDPFIAEFTFTHETDAADGIVTMIIPAGCFMEDMIIVLNEPFDDGCTISVGSGSDPNLYYDSAYLYPQDVNVPVSFEADINVSTTEPTPVYLYIKNPGTKGSGTLKITVG